MIFSILPERVATILIGSKPVIVTFMSVVLGVGGANTKSVEVLKKDEFNQGQTIIINPKKKKIDESLIVFTKERSYEFFIKSSKAGNAHNFIKVKSGKINAVYKKKKQASNYNYFEGDDSIKIENTASYPLIINGIEVKRQEYFSKGIPLFISTQNKLPNESVIFVKEAK